MSVFDRRIIIGGLPRSGSTLLRFILDASSTIISGPEANFFDVPLFQKQAHVDKVAKKLAVDLEIEEKDIRASILNSHDSLEAYDGIMTTFSKRAGVYKGAWAEKTPRNCHSYHRLALEDPNAYFISTVRHGLDVITSKLDESQSDEYYCTIQRYVDCMRCIYGFNHPRHFILKYEDLVKKPAESIASLFAFVELPFEQKVLEDFNRQSHSRDFSKVQQPKVKQSIQTTWIDRYAKPEHADRVRQFLDRTDAKEWLHRSGYEAQAAMR
jgi:hypothetical protein